MDERKLKSIVRDLFKEFFSPFKQSMQQEVNEIKNSVQYMSDKFEEQRNKMDEMLAEIKKLRDEKALLQQRVNLLERKMNTIEQKEKENNLVVVGIPKQNNEPRISIEKVFQTMKVELTEEDIVDVYPINKNENALIIVKCKTYTIKEKIIKRIRELKGIKISECGLDGGRKNIYFNDDLTQKNQILFKKVREFKKVKQYKSVFASNGKKEQFP